MNAEATPRCKRCLQTISVVPPYFIPELDLIAVTDAGFLIGHGVFSALPMGDDGRHVVCLNSLAVRHGDNDNHTRKNYQYQRKGIDTAIVNHGLDAAKTLGFTACVTEGNPAVYQRKMGFQPCVEAGITADDGVNAPPGCLFAKALVPGGFEHTNKILGCACYDFTKTEPRRG